MEVGTRVEFSAVVNTPININVNSLLLRLLHSQQHISHKDISDILTFDTHARMCCAVAVLQFSNSLPHTRKILLYFYIYLYIYKYRVCFWLLVVVILELQHRNTATSKDFFLKKVSETFVNRNGNVVTLHSELGKAAASPHALPKGGKSVVTPL